ncbi:MAG: alpha-N-arabinofuranosidase [Anaerolineae bacterium]|nr:alpha-N-arabinofuranosidase [Anaerolineae bacterium]
MATCRIIVHPNDSVGLISPYLYGHFAEHLGACIDGGVWVGEGSPIPNIGGIRRDVVEALKRIRPPVLRWPGGCFADDYHWRDGIGPRHARPRRVNIWWGETIECNEFGTHEFIQFCRLIGAEPYICGNVGSGSPRELRDWVEYCNFPGGTTLSDERAANGSPEPFGVRFWGVGNENWGCGGHFVPEDYATEYRRFSTYLRDLGETPLYLIACGPSSNDPEWTRRFFTKLGNYRRIHGFAAHYYCGTAGTATEYTLEQWYELIQRGLLMERLIVQQRAVMDGFDPDRKIGLIVDEWGTWHPPTPGRDPRHLWQQNTLRDALVAAATLDIFNRHADKVVMANIAQTVNVLQAMILTEGERMLTTPTYHVFDMYQVHQGALSLRVGFEADDITCSADGKDIRLPGLMGSASRQGSRLALSVVNPHAMNPAEATIELPGARCRIDTATVLTHADLKAHNTFDAPERVKPTVTHLSLEGSQVRYTFAPASVTVLEGELV